MFSPKLRNPYKDDPQLPICAPSPAVQGNKSFWTVKRAMWLLLLALFGVLTFRTTTDGSEGLDYSGNDPDRVKSGDSTENVLRTQPPSSRDDDQEALPRTQKPYVVEPVDPDPIIPDVPAPRTVPPQAWTPPPNPAIHHGHKKQALQTSLLKNAILWLDSSAENLSSSSTTVAWSDSNIANKLKFDFTSIPPEKVKSNGYSNAFSELVKSAVKADPSNPSNSELQSLALTDETYVPTVSDDSTLTFPAPLYTPKFSLPHHSTLFFVVTPDYLGGKTESFQTFFTVGGSKFMFSHGKVAFLTKDNNDNQIQSFLGGSKGHLEKGVKHLVAYKFNREAPLMSLNGSPFEHGSSHTKDNQAFTSNVKAFLGGGGPTDGFVGKVEEVMIFNQNLKDDQASEVMNHLAEKWKIEGMEDDVDLASGSLLTAIGDEDDDGKQINGEDNDTIEAQIKLAEKKKEEEEERNKDKFDPKNRSEKTQRLDEIHAKAIEESRKRSEEEVKQRQEEAQKGMVDPMDVLYTVEKANKHVPGPCKGAGDAFKGVPLKVWEEGPDGQPKQVDWSPSPNADLDDINKWEEGHAASQKVIRQYTSGGEGLKTVVHKEAKKLQKLRHDLFCSKGGGIFKGGDQEI